MIQNKLLWAISEQTAAELVYRRVDSRLPLLGMQSFDKKNSVYIKKSDVNIAKNYLNEEEIKLLGLLVEQYLAFAETMAQQQVPMFMADWIERPDSILQLNGGKLLTHAGKISQEMALKKQVKNLKNTGLPVTIHPRATVSKVPTTRQVIVLRRCLLMLGASYAQR